MSPIFVLHALAARKMLREHKIRRRHAAGRSVVHASRSEAREAGRYAVAIAFEGDQARRRYPLAVLDKSIEGRRYGSSLLGRDGVLNFGSTAPSRRYFLMVLRDNPVRRAISWIGMLSRNAQRRITLKNPISITPYLPDQIRQGNVFTWVKSQWKFGALPGHF